MGRMAVGEAGDGSAGGDPAYSYWPGVNARGGGSGHHKAMARVIVVDLRRAVVRCDQRALEWVLEQKVGMNLRSAHGGAMERKRGLKLFGCLVEGMDFLGRIQGQVLHTLECS